MESASLGEIRRRRLRKGKMNKFKGLLICTDLDGTLLRNDKSISRENLEAIEYFKSEGGLFTFITGRMPFFVGKIVDTIRPNAPIGCINGGGVYDFSCRRYLRLLTLRRDVTELIEAVDSSVEGIGIQVNTPERIYFARENSAMVHFREATGMPNLVKDYRDVDEPFAKIVFGDEREEAILKTRDVLLSHPRAKEFGFIRSERTLFEILPKGISKGTALESLAEVCGVEMKNTVALGDYDNDIGMLRTAGLGVAVSNATDGAKAAADRITVSNEEHAIAKIISELA